MAEDWDKIADDESEWGPGYRVSKREPRERRDVAVTVRLPLSVADSMRAAAGQGA